MSLKVIKTIGKYLVITLGLLVLAIILMFIFMDALFTKNDARMLVEEQGILLTNEFELKENKTLIAPGDYYHRFVLRISEEDKSKAIEQIRSSIDYSVGYKEPDDRMWSLMHPELGDQRYFGPKQVWNYETVDACVREYFEPSGKRGYSPTFRRITINKEGNKLIFEDIDE